MPDFKAEIRARLAEASISRRRAKRKSSEELSQHLEGSIRAGAESRRLRRRSRARPCSQEFKLPDSLDRELKQRGASRSGKCCRNGTGKERAICWQILDKTCVTACACLAKESGFHHRCGHCARARHRREQRDFQRRQRDSAAAPALQKSRATRDDLGERDTSRLSEGHAVARELSRLA